MGQELSRNERIVARSCLSSEIAKVEAFVAEKGGADNKLNGPFIVWLEIANGALAKLQGDS